MTTINLFFTIIVLCSTVWQLSIQTAIPEQPFYTAGVVEFQNARRTTNSSSLEYVENNLNGYLEIIASSAAAPTDIIIFPESTLNNRDQLTFVPDPMVELVAPCDDINATMYHRLLVQLSCQAKSSSKYIVVNLSEKELCSSVPSDPRPCATNGFNIYNTNVVFDRSGAVVSRYRKVHLYVEPTNSTYYTQYGIFDTDFGIRFGHFICFDILFYTPAQDLVDKLDIKDFIFPSMWFSQLPFLTAAQMQFAWAYANDVNLLAAGASNPQIGSTGTGIYAGRNGPLVMVMNQKEGVRRLYVAQVPKHRYKRTLDMDEITSIKSSVSDNNTVQTPHRKETSIVLKRDYLQNYKSIALDMGKENFAKHQLCYGENFCCTFELTWHHLYNKSNDNDFKHYIYRLGVYDDWRNEADVDANKVKNCAVFTCISEDIMDCGKVFPTDVHNVRAEVAFERIIIEATFPKLTKHLLMPNSLRDDLLPVPVDDIEWSTTEDGSNINARFVLNASTDNLLTFAIYGNYFEQEEQQTGGGRASMVVISLLWCIIVGLISSTSV